MTHLDRARKAMEETPEKEWGKEQDIFAAELKDLAEQNKEESKMKIEQIIQDVENGKVKLDNDPTFFEREGINGTEHFIEFFVEGYEGDDYIQVLFAEKDHIKEARKKNNVGDLSDEALEELLNDSSNGYDDIYNFDKVVAISSEPMGLEWL